jgi:prephenate dehydratase
VRVAYLGPEGTFTHEALIAAAHGRGLELLAAPTITAS